MKDDLQGSGGDLQGRQEPQGERCHARCPDGYTWVKISPTYLAKHKQALVDVRRFFEHHTLALAVLESLTSSQIHKTDFT